MATVDRRESALDGLRGLAAAGVVVHHVVLASSPSVTSAYLAGDTAGMPIWARASSFLWAGHAFVIVFFVLSGYVLALPNREPGSFNARAYYPSRLVRLFFPVWGALALAAGVRAVAGHPASGAASAWLNAHAAGVSLSDVLHQASLPGGNTYALLGVLWSMHWEVLFSLLLPAFVLVARRSRTWHAPLAAAAFAVMAVGHRHAAAAYMPTFLLGTLLAFNRPALERLRLVLAAPTREGRASRAAVIIGAVALLGYAQAPALDAAGAVLAVVAALTIPALGRMLDARPAQWLGSRSFSLYLVHEPVVVALAFALGLPGFPVLLGVAAVAALIAAELCHRALERPSHQAARRLAALGREASGQRRLRAQPAPSP